MSFMDTYSCYDQIPMYELDRENRTFMTDQANYQYNGMPFGIKSMDNILENDATLEVYIDDMIVMSGEEELHDDHLFFVNSKESNSII